VPNVITSSGPGDLFTLRNLGNLVPPPGHDSDSSVAAALSYAAKQLQVPTILVCGHSGCGAMQALIGGHDLDEPLNRWLRWGVPSLTALRDGHPVGLAAATEGRPEVDQLSMINVALQVEMLHTYPVLRDAVAAGRIHIAGLFLDIPTARLLILDPAAGRFLPMPDQPPDGLILSGTTARG
jgi:carbonic anhydrase